MHELRLHAITKSQQKSPCASVALQGFSLCFALRTAVSVSAIWGPREAPKFAPVSHIYRQTEAIADDQRTPIN